MSDLVPKPDDLDQVYGQIRQVLSEARSRAWQAVNSAITGKWGG